MVSTAFADRRELLTAGFDLLGRWRHRELGRWRPSVGYGDVDWTSWQRADDSMCSLVSLDVLGMGRTGDH
jgi:hypothetical protein